MGMVNKMVPAAKFLIMNYFSASTSSWLRPVICIIKSNSQFACFINFAVSRAFLYEPSAKPCALADIITRSGRYVRTSTNCLGFAVFSMWGIGPMLPILWASDEYFAKTASSMGQDYADKFQALVSPPVIGGWLVLSLLVAYACALLGMKVLHRHFERAGVA